MDNFEKISSENKKEAYTCIYEDFDRVRSSSVIEQHKIEMIEQTQSNQGEKAKQDLILMENALKNLEEDRRKDFIIGQEEKQKIEDLISSELKLKIKTIELMDELKNVEIQQSNKLKIFKQYIQKSNLDQKNQKLIDVKAEELFAPLDYKNFLNKRPILYLNRFQIILIPDNLNGIR
ncbi:hypothetical protein PPERSA_06555 [Pseudocohnilembus persalinus]|uniref:Uncharacterized protein n=1 Tax=Pseudocohnilembus persalinus TaxID=266149 RepID=A0A0V0QRL7_PSEPJ|nr:hypothetical protein PPERSA_06555 [Pseudocohnilembus persalinus]|eukprot:KRX04921.1 hypothetical protein PPERSA_06555 [Pseudocohnilembus persalinus]